MSAYYALLLIHLHFPEAGSLKAKRKELASVKAQLHTRLGAAVAEVDHQDTWQRATVGVVSVNQDRVYLAQLLEKVSTESERILGGDLVDSHLEYLE